MALSGIDAVVFGVTSMAEAKRFLDDWGVSKVATAPDKLVYETRDHTAVIVRPSEALRPSATNRNRQHGARSDLGRCR